MRKTKLRCLLAVATGVVLAGTAYAPAAFGASPAFRSPHALQRSVDAISRTGTVGVLAESTGPDGRRYATAGTSNPTSGARVSPADAFRIGSSTKSFVATVVLQLVGEGRLSLDDTVDHWLPGVVSGNGNDGRKITVRQLLQHTGGLFDYTADLPEISSTADFQADRFTHHTPEQLVAIAMRHKPDFAPGTAWQYSNTDYVLAGMIIQKVTGHTWGHEVEARIIKPLGLRNTTVPGDDPYLHGPHLEGYSNFGSGPAVDVTDVNMSWGGAAGELVSTADDLSRFYRALVGGRLLPSAQLAQMETTVPVNADFDTVWPGARYGLGLMWVPLKGGGGYWGHGGDVNGYSTRDGVSPDGRRSVVVEETGDGTPADLKTERAMDSLVARQLSAPDRK